MIKIIITVLAGLFAIVLIKQFRPEYSFLIRLCVIAMILITAITGFQAFAEQLASVVTGEMLDAQYLTLMAKVIGISVVVEAAANTCRDCAETALASKVEFVGKIAIVSLALPIVQEILKLCISLVGS